MKRLLLIPALLITIFSFSQGIEFEHGTWSEVLAKAQQTNKPIFVDIYTTWCGPCKMMSKDIFPLEEVGKVYNEKFVCYKVDAEKGEGIELAKKYEIRAYPTYLFVKSDGTLFYKALGSMPADKFIKEATSAIAELADPKPLSVWDAEYAVKKTDPAFLLEYMKKRSKLSSSNASIFNEYLALLHENERTSDAIVDLYQQESRSIKLNTLAFANLQKNKEVFTNKGFRNIDNLLYNCVMGAVNDAAKTKNQDLFTAALVEFDKLPKNAAAMQKDEICMLYYGRTGETDKYMGHASNFAKNYLMKMSLDSITKKDQNSYKTMEKQLNSGGFGKLDSAQIVQIKEYYSHAERDKISRSLNNMAWEAFNKVTDKKMLQTALSWSKRSLEIYPNYPLWLDTYANLHFKLGKKKDAISIMNEALRYTDKKDVEQYKQLEATLAKMKTPEIKEKK